MQCEQELCEYWTGQGCVCEFMDLVPNYTQADWSHDLYYGLGEE